jgi:hypothetical protein
MMLLRRPLIAALAAAAALAVGAPAANASTVPKYHFSVPAAYQFSLPVAVAAGTPMGPCAAIGPEGQLQDRTGGTDIQSCGVLSFVGPSSSVSTVIGPTIISPSFVGSAIVAGGNVIAGP